MVFKGEKGRQCHLGDLGEQLDRDHGPEQHPQILP
jgi:hypothetical protein